MTARWRPWRPHLAALATLFVLGLGLRAAAFAVFPHPGYPDADYYAAVAREIAAGHGLVAPYLWSFLDVGSTIPAAPTLPVPAFGHWMPLASFVQVPFIWILGPTDLASALPAILAGGALGPLAYLLARDLAPGSNAPLAGLLATGGGVVAGYLAQPDNYALFALTAGGALWSAGAVARDGRAPLRRMALAGLLAGLAALGRNDGLLLIGAITASPWLAWRGRRIAGRKAAWALLAGVGVALLVLLPWWLRQLATFGSIYPSASTGRILFIRDPLEMFSADGPLPMSHLLDWGAGPLIASRLAAAGQATLILGGGVLAIAGIPLVIAGAWSLRGRLAAFTPFAAWLVLWLAFEVLLAAPHLASGNLLHSALTILPFAAVAAACGLQGFRGPSLAFLAGSMAAVTISLALAATAIAQAGGTLGDLRAAEAQVLDYLAARDPGARVMSPDPGGLWIVGGVAGIQTPDSALPVIARAANAYDVHWLLILRAQAVPALGFVLTGARPDWLGPAALSGPLDPAGAPAWALYPVLPDGG